MWRWGKHIAKLQKIQNRFICNWSVILNEGDYHRQKNKWNIQIQTSQSYSFPRFQIINDFLESTLWKKRPKSVLIKISTLLQQKKRLNIVIILLFRKEQWQEINSYMKSNKLKFLLEMMFRTYPDKLIGERILPVKIIPQIFKAYGIS